MRGKMVDLSLQTLDLRITPAYARKSRTSAPALPGYRDHPRIRGENPSPQRTGRESLGSPPHTRGKCEDMPEEERIKAITPAYAGKMLRRGFYVQLLWDHPRIRGENPSPQRTGRESLGSPPHTRGKSCRSARVTSLSGITPAYAGKIPIRTICFSATRDHPRIRGENILFSNMAKPSSGSPPHTRGK